MKTKFFAAALIAAFVVTGCYSTQDGRTKAGMPFSKDKIEGRYERTPDQICQAAKKVVKDNGVLINETTIHTTTNSVRTVEGKVNQRSVWIKVQEVDPKVTAVVVQARTKAGWSDIELAHELEKQIALELAR